MGKSEARVEKRPAPSNTFAVLKWKPWSISELLSSVSGVYSALTVVFVGVIYLCAFGFPCHISSVTVCGGEVPAGLLERTRGRATGCVASTSSAFSPFCCLV